MTSSKKKRGHVTSTNKIALGHLVKLLLEPDTLYSADELAEQTGLSRQTVQGYCRAFRQVGVAYVARWGDDSAGIPKVKLMKLGIDKRDARRERKPRADLPDRIRSGVKANEIGNILAGGNHAAR